MTIQEMLDDYKGKMAMDSYDDDMIEFTTEIGNTLYDYLFVRYIDEPIYILDNNLGIDRKPELNALLRKYKLGSKEKMIAYDFVFFLVDEQGQRHTGLTGTGGGKVASVFSASKKAFEEFMSRTKGNFDLLHFTAKEESRIHVYDRFADMMVQVYGWSLETYQAESKSYLLFNTEHLELQ